MPLHRSQEVTHRNKRIQLDGPGALVCTQAPDTGRERGCLRPNGNRGILAAAQFVCLGWIKRPMGHAGSHRERTAMEIARATRRFERGS